MKEIKFRAYDETDKCWVKMYISDNALKPQGGLPSYIHLMQFVGIQDKNENDVYEKDIVKFRYGQKYLIAIVHDLNEYGIFLHLKPQGAMFWTNLRQRETLEVIGNIYENKELLG
jgi:uncharacterized phage protein (TIGR01671 family)